MESFIFKRRTISKATKFFILKRDVLEESQHNHLIIIVQVMNIIRHAQEKMIQFPIPITPLTPSRMSHKLKKHFAIA